MFEISKAYAPRPTRSAGRREHDGWRLKMYEITCGGETIDTSAYEEGLPRALEDLPTPAESPHRPGIGFVICHQGAGAHYLVLCWWDNENELPIRVWVKPRDGEATWRPAGRSESVCVWDLRVIDFERRAYIEHVLGRPAAPDVEAYLQREFTVEIAPATIPGG